MGAGETGVNCEEQHDRWNRYMGHPVTSPGASKSSPGTNHTWKRKRDPSRQELQKLYGMISWEADLAQFELPAEDEYGVSTGDPRAPVQGVAALLQDPGGFAPETLRHLIG